MLSDEDLECPVCSEDFTTTSVGATTSPRLLVQCGHALCLECAQKVTQCPMCRVDYLQPQGHVRHRLLERLIAAITKPGETGGERDYSSVISELVERQLKEGARVATQQQHRKLLAEEVTRRQRQQAGKCIFACRGAGAAGFSPRAGGKRGAGAPAAAVRRSSRVPRGHGRSGVYHRDGGPR